MLVGRDAERQAVDAVVAGARLGRSGVLVLTGEAGIGKTSLLEYAASVATGATLLRATGSEAERDVPFGGLAQLFRPTAGRPRPAAGAAGAGPRRRAGTAVRARSRTGSRSAPRCSACWSGGARTARSG